MICFLVPLLTAQGREWFHPHLGIARGRDMLVYLISARDRGSCFVHLRTARDRDSLFFPHLRPARGRALFFLVCHAWDRILLFSTCVTRGTVIYFLVPLLTARGRVLFFPVAPRAGSCFVGLHVRNAWGRDSLFRSATRRAGPRFVFCISAPNGAVICCFVLLRRCGRCGVHHKAY